MTDDTKTVGEPLFSVIIPVYNSERYLARCVDSVLGQTYRDFELILVDDGSADGCPAICDGYAEQDSRVRVVHKLKNEGLVSARNTGIRNAHGKYVCYVDSDDWVEICWLETVEGYIREFFEPDMLLFGVVHEYETYSQKILVRLESGYYDKARLLENVYPNMMADTRERSLQGMVTPTAWDKIYKRGLLTEHYCRDERISLMEDTSFTYECLYSAASVYICGECLYHYNRCNNESMSIQYYEDFLTRCRYALRYMERRLSGEPQLNVQLNSVKAVAVIQAMVGEVQEGPNMRSVIRRIKANREMGSMLRECRLRGVPVYLNCYFWLLKMHGYHLAWLGTKLYLKIRFG